MDKEVIRSLKEEDRELFADFLASEYVHAVARYLKAKRQFTKARNNEVRLNSTDLGQETVLIYNKLRAEGAEDLIASLLADIQPTNGNRTSGDVKHRLKKSRTKRVKT